ncbi:FkbM family methyltransferase [Novosphingobium flavum]|uniref:FkbM family methyltransferase n=1 Tax=Novosphingobium flavum TaxID=1778672 RepID=A0A7X1FQ16_9SPHN|nr:FkbM family methyltransferase [Novosphingobium flavum]MBC2664427.1 FkbM family methyltransferase [Novosphingobium flavum]
MRRISGRIPAFEKARLSNRTYSQEGEDRVLARLFDTQETGFYVDVGAFHPFLYSNTQIFYETGWRGLNIDATPGSMTLFRRFRPHDTNVEIGIGASPATIKFFIFNVGALNTFDEALAKARAVEPFRIEKVVEVPVLPLSDVLARHLPAGTAIDFLTVDVEGRDLEVLRSNDWERFRPRYVLAELFGSKVEDGRDDELTVYLRELGYVPVAKTVNTWFFEDSAQAV